MDELRVYIEKGIPDNHVYTYEDAADEYLNVRSGPILFKVETVPHKLF